MSKMKIPITNPVLYCLVLGAAIAALLLWVLWRLVAERFT
jgi:uncharacterized protein (DUF2062 family)